MNLIDFVLKQKVNFAIAQDRRIRFFDVGVIAHDGKITMNGGVDTPWDARAIEEVACAVDGVVSVFNEITVGVDGSERAEFLTERLLAKLDEEWDELPKGNPIFTCDYMRWA